MPVNSRAWAHRRTSLAAKGFLEQKQCCVECPMVDKVFYKSSDGLLGRNVVCRESEFERESEWSRKLTPITYTHSSSILVVRSRLPRWDRIGRPGQRENHDFVRGSVDHGTFKWTDALWSASYISVTYTAENSTLQKNYCFVSGNYILLP